MNLFIVFATIAIAFALGFLISASKSRKYTNAVIESHRIDRCNEYMRGFQNGWLEASENVTNVKASYFKLFPVIYK